VPLTAVRHGRWTKVTAAVDAFDPADRAEQHARHRHRPRSRPSCRE
jgi:hypothetical protein